MRHDPASTHYRRTIRLPTYNYAQAGAYFVTICTYERQHSFGRVVDDAMSLSAHGEIAASAWAESVGMRAEMALDAFVVMPNHVHGIVVIVDRRTSVPGADRVVGRDGRTSVRPYATTGDDGARQAGRTSVRPYENGGQPPSTKRTLGRFVAAYKAAVTAAINTQRGTPGAPVWQRNYYEHIIRNEEDMNRIREYISNNPARWSTDPENTPRPGPPP